MRSTCVVLTLLHLAFLSGLRGEVSVPALFSDHMVLQQKRANPIWGWASPGEEVWIELAGQRHQVTADSDGKWQIYLDSLPAGGPYLMTVRGSNLIEIEDVLVGEVWIASGQSNMQFSVDGTPDAAQTIAQSESPEIRLFQVARHSALQPQLHTPSQWRACTPSTIGRFSAVAYFFGKRMHEVLEVPVGLIEASWGGTNAEEWTRRGELETEPVFGPILERWEQVDPSIRALFKQNSELELQLDDLLFLPVDPNDSPLMLDDFEDGNLQNRLFGHWSAAPPNAWGYRDLATGGSQERALRYVTSTRPGTSNYVQVQYTPGRYLDLSRYAALRFRCRGKGFLRFHSLQPSVTDWDQYVTPPLRLSPEWRTLTVHFSDLSQAGWGKPQPFTAARLSGALFELQPAETLPRPPSGLFNGMIHPLIPFGVRGVIWYQGEGNAGRAYQYRDLLPAMIRSWRLAWENPDLPFLVVQLPGYRARQAQPTESAWAELREAQLLTAQNDRNVGLAVTIDLGEDDDVHPREKHEVGRRLSLLAEGIVYGREDAFSGPQFRALTREGSSLRLSFAHTSGGLVSAGGPPLRGFAIAGEDRKFHWADAQVDGETVIVSSREVPNPVAVRYAWSDNPVVSLYSAAGLPASPFRTDDWPGTTVDQH